MGLVSPLVSLGSLSPILDAGCGHTATPEAHNTPSLPKSAATTAQLAPVRRAGPQPPGADHTALLLLQKSAPGTAPRSQRVTACRLACTTANPISSSFFTQMSGN